MHLLKQRKLRQFVQGNYVWILYGFSVEWGQVLEKFLSRSGNCINCCHIIIFYKFKCEVVFVSHQSRIRYICMMEGLLTKNSEITSIRKPNRILRQIQGSAFFLGYSRAPLGVTSFLIKDISKYIPLKGRDFFSRQTFESNG